MSGHVCAVKIHSAPSSREVIRAERIDGDTGDGVVEDGTLKEVGISGGEVAGKEPSVAVAEDRHALRIHLLLAMSLGAHVLVLVRVHALVNADACLCVYVSTCGCHKGLTLACRLNRSISASRQSCTSCAH